MSANTAGTKGNTAGASPKGSSGSTRWAVAMRASRAAEPELRLGKLCLEHTEEKQLLSD